MEASICAASGFCWPSGDLRTFLSYQKSPSPDLFRVLRLRKRELEHNFQGRSASMEPKVFILVSFSVTNMVSPKHGSLFCRDGAELGSNGSELKPPRLRIGTLRRKAPLCSSCARTTLDCHIQLGVPVLEGAIFTCFYREARRTTTMFGAPPNRRSLPKGQIRGSF